nr:hypothetical protein [Tanacetum cinerariifolium]
MLLLVVQHKLFHLDGDVIVDLAVHCVCLLEVSSSRRESKCLIGCRKLPKEAHYHQSFDPLGVVYEDLSNQNGLRRADELYKFLDGTLKKNWRDLSGDIPLDRIEVLRYDKKGVKVRKRMMQTKKELTLEQTQQGVSDEVLHEVNEIRAEKIARVANPLALVAQQQPVYHPQNHPTHYNQNSSTKSQQAATRNRGKATVNTPQPIYDQEPFIVDEDDETSTDKEIDKLIALISLSNVGYENKRNGNVVGAMETVGSSVELKAYYMYMAQLQQVSPDAVDSGPIFDDEPLQKVSNDDHYNVFAIECTYPVQSESVLDTYPFEQDAQNMIINSLDMSYDKEGLTSMMMIMILPKNMELECEKVRGDLLSYKMYYQKSCTKYTETINALNQTISEMKDKLSAHQETISILSKQKEAHIKLYKTQEDQELDKAIELENKFKVLDNIVYKTGQSVQTMNMLNNKCRTSFAKLEFLKKVQRANPRLYDIGCYNDNLALMLTPDSDEVIRLDKESRSKLSDLIRPFDYEKLNNLNDLFVPQHENSSEQRYFLERSRLSHINVNHGKSKESFNKQTTLLEKRMDESIPLDKQCQSSLEIFKVK